MSSTIKHPHINSQAYAKSKDAEDVLKDFRHHFYFPIIDGKPCVYLCGNSLGLQPKNVRAELNAELEDWQNMAVEGHFRATNPWLHHHKTTLDDMAVLVGASAEEVVAMNNLTVNLHLMMVSFYQPTATRFKIIMEAGAFPSDQYAVETQVKWHGYNPDDAIVELAPREGERTLRPEDIEATILAHGESVALVMMGGINYYTGQVFDMETITKIGHSVGAYVGFDLAHAAGNVHLALHDWGMDFAVWCTYKYLNSGPGSVGGVFVHQRHAHDTTLPRLAGWWGQREDERFLMQKGFRPMVGAAGWQLSNQNILGSVGHRASLQLFTAAGMDRLIEKSIALTGYLEALLLDMNAEGTGPYTEIITPKDARGCQLSLVIEGGKAVFNHLMAHNVLCDWREPDVIRLAPAPIYNNFEDVYNAVQVIKAFNA